MNLYKRQPNILIRSQNQTKGWFDIEKTQKTIQKPKISFINSNSNEAFEELLKIVILEKIKCENIVYAVVVKGESP